MAEQFALHETGRDGPTADPDKRAPFSGTLIHNGPGNEFFSGTALPSNQNGGITGSHLDNLGKYLPYGPTVADDGGKHTPSIHHIQRMGHLLENFGKLGQLV